MSPTASDTLFRASYGTCDAVSDLCPVERTMYGSRFNLGGNIFFAIFFGILCAIHVYRGAVQYKTWPFTIWVSIGALLETLGYIARTVMHFNPWSLELLSMQLCTLLWGPTCVAAGISVMFKHIVIYCGPQHSLLRPKLIPWLFIGTDVVSLIIQGIGGIIASVGTGRDASKSGLLDIGSDMVIAGVAFQVVNMVICGGLVLLYLYRYKQSKKTKRSSKLDTSSSSEQDSDPEMNKPTITTATETSQTPYDLAKQHDPKFAPRNLKLFTSAIALAFTAVLIRCIYRVPEMAAGWANEIMRDEPTFLIFDGTMVCISLIVLATIHPGQYFPFILSTTSKVSSSSSSKKHLPTAVDKDRDLVQSQREKDGSDTTLGV